MDKINPKIKLYIQLGFFAVIWILILIVSGVTSILDLTNVIKKFPLAVTLYAFISFFFVKWAWRWKIFYGWLIKIPDLQGTWIGTLTSTWIDPTTKNILSPIPVTLTIRQTFNKIDCLLYTNESSSYSMVAEVNIDRGGDLYLNYNYTNRSRASLRERSEIHDGAAILKIIKSPNFELNGDYWTSRSTTGEMRLEFKTKKIIEKFVE